MEEFTPTIGSDDDEIEDQECNRDNDSCMYLFSTICSCFCLNYSF